MTKRTKMNSCEIAKNCEALAFIAQQASERQMPGTTSGYLEMRYTFMKHLVVEIACALGGNRDGFYEMMNQADRQKSPDSHAADSASRPE